VKERLDFIRGALEEEGRDPADFQLIYQNVLWFSDDANPKMPLTGPAEAIAEGLGTVRDLGVTHVDLIVFGPPGLITETAARFAEEVRPAL
jgi:hypothetical protein